VSSFNRKFNREFKSAPISSHQRISQCIWKYNDQIGLSSIQSSVKSVAKPTSQFDLKGVQVHCRKGLQQEQEQQNCCIVVDTNNSEGNNSGLSPIQFHYMESRVKHTQSYGSWKGMCRSVQCESSSSWNKEGYKELEGILLDCHRYNPVSWCHDRMDRDGEDGC
jgi:hypothetical protein